MEKETNVKLETTLGEIIIKLYNDTPKHRNNFIKLATEGYYNGVLFHRVIKDFMIQTGDGDSRTATPTQQLGVGGPGYTIDAEILYPKYFHKKGALAAARQGDQVNPERKSSGSQFYIVTGKTFPENQINALQSQLLNSQRQDLFRKLVNQNRELIMELQSKGDSDGIKSLQEQLIAETDAQLATTPAGMSTEQIDTYMNIGGTPHLDNQYTVFGEVISGLEIIDKIQSVKTGKADRPKEDIKIIKATIND